MSRYVSVLLVICGIGASAFASVQGGVSTDSAVRQIQANIDDWQNEEAKAAPERDSSCREARLIRIVWKSGLVASPPIKLATMPKLMTLPISSQSVTDFVNEAFNGVDLGATEQSELDGLKNRAIRSDADNLGLAIGAQQLAIAVSNRIFSASIETYYDRALVADSYSKLDGAEDTCNEDTLRLSRDGAMIAASQVLLELYRQQSAAAQAAVPARD